MATLNGSIVDYLNSIGQDSSYSARAKLASQYGIPNYSGTAAQNTQLLGILSSKSTPTAAPAVTPTTGTISPATQSLLDKAAALSASVTANNPAVFSSTSSTPTSPAPNSPEYFLSLGYTQAQANQLPSLVKQLGSAEAAAQYMGWKVPTANTQPKNQAELDAQYAAAAIAHPAFTGNSASDIAYATSTGDYSKLLNSNGQPFSSADQAAALSEATSAVSPYYQAEQTKETADTEATLQAKQAAYQKYLDDQATQFQSDKTGQDQTAANNGVLFSGARVQKLQQLGDAYTKNNAYQKNAYGADIASTARDFGYKYGDTAAGGLSKYYNLGGNTYNPNVATGGVGSSGLSTIYNANQGFQGTEINAAKTEAQKRAALLLGNKGNKLVGTGYTNQY